MSDPAFVPEHHFPEPAADFDWRALDGEVLRTHGPRKPDLGLAADGLTRMLQWCWPPRRSVRVGLRVGFRRFVAVSMTLRPELLDNCTFAQVAREVGVTKAALSKHSVDFEREFGLQFRRGRSATARAHMRAARMRK